MAFIGRFVIENLPQTVTLEEVYTTLELGQFPGQGFIQLSFAVDKNGNSLGRGFVEIPLSSTTRLMKFNGCKIKDQPVKISEEKKKSYLLKGKKWVKTYNEQGMVQTRDLIPRLSVPCWLRNTETISSNQELELGSVYDMCAELTHGMFTQELDSVICKSYEQGIEAIVIPGRCRKQRQKALDLISHYKAQFNLYLSTGIGPSCAREYDEKEASQIEKECSLDSCPCIGPVGLDFRLNRVPKDVQIKAFEEQVKLACEKNIPMYLVEHEAHEDFVNILTKYIDKLPKCAIVDFTGSLEELELYVDMGFYIVITGEIKHSRYMLTAVVVEALRTKMIPKMKILLSSNAPRYPQANLIFSGCYRHSVSDETLNKVFPSFDKPSCRSEPLCVFATLELTAKYMGLNAPAAIRNFQKCVLENSKSFLFKKRDRTKEERDLSRRKSTRTANQCGKENKFKILIVICTISAFLLAIFIEWLFGFPELQNRYFHNQIVF